MSKWTKIRQQILSGQADQNVSFEDLVAYLKRIGFEVRVKGSHHIFYQTGIIEIINLQPRADGTAKPYQVKQVRNVVLNYKLGGDDDKV